MQNEFLRRVQLSGITLHSSYKSLPPIIELLPLVAFRKEPINPSNLSLTQRFRNAGKERTRGIVRAP
jgi:hypothetical protein